MSSVVKFFTIFGMVLFATALCWAYPRTVLFEDFTNYG